MVSLSEGPKTKCQEDWQNFHNDLVERNPKTLDRLIFVIETCVKCARGDGPPLIKDNTLSTTRGTFQGPITKQAIFKQFNQYQAVQIYTNQIKDNETLRYSYNFGNNLLRALKAVKSNQGFMLPEADKRLVCDFIGWLKHPPRIY